MFIPRIVITPGEPAGIGPDVTVLTAQFPWEAELIVVGSPDLLRARAQQLNLPLTLDVIDWTQAVEKHKPGNLKIFPVEMAAVCAAGKLNPANAEYVIRTLEMATAFCLHHKADALVTGPVNKKILNSPKFHFSGHTEFLAERCQTAQSIMLFVIDTMKVALVTTHIPLAYVPTAITQEKLEKMLRLLHQELNIKFHLTAPKIYVCGLNPHAGEEGMLGNEEITVIKPVIEKLKAEKMHITGPLPADTIFTTKHMQAADVIVAMYHDQALPVVKYIGFDRAVNVTLGLPIIRTSVDHGTALDIAGTQNVNPGSMAEAIRLAIALSGKQREQRLV